MEREGLVIVNLDEIAANWQVPVGVVKAFICERELDPAHPGAWLTKEENATLLISEKQKVFEAAVFPQRVRTPTANGAKTV